MLRDIDHGFGAPPHLHRGGRVGGGGGESEEREGEGRGGVGGFSLVLIGFFSRSVHVFFFFFFPFFPFFFAFFFHVFPKEHKSPLPSPPVLAPPLPSKFCMRLFSGCFFGFI